MFFQKTKQILAKTLVMSLMIFFVFFNFVLVKDLGAAQLQPIDGVAYPIGDGNFGPYVIGMARIFIGIAAVLAIIYIMIGGIQYITTDSISNKESGKDMINSSLLGLLLALASWLLLNTINPQLVNTIILDFTAY